MAEADRRQHERILINMPTRMWLDEQYRGKAIMFEGFASTRDLAIGGTFLNSQYLLPIGFPINLEMRIEGEDVLRARGEIVHALSSQETDEPGMGIMFTALDADNRERLLRFFISDRIRSFYSERFLVEFPHLEGTLSLEDVALVVNLWEDREGRLASLRQPPSKGRARAIRQQEIRATQERARR